MLRRTVIGVTATCLVSTSPFFFPLSSWALNFWDKLLLLFFLRFLTLRGCGRTSGGKPKACKEGESTEEEDNIFVSECNEVRDEVVREGGSLNFLLVWYKDILTYGKGTSSDAEEHMEISSSGVWEASSRLQGLNINCGGVKFLIGVMPC
jgi:hypothetical protein